MSKIYHSLDPTGSLVLAKECCLPVLENYYPGLPPGPVSCPDMSNNTFTVKMVFLPTVSYK